MADAVTCIPFSLATFRLYTSIVGSLNTKNQTAIAPNTITINAEINNFFFMQE
jgi:hypothetical protein